MNDEQRKALFEYYKTKVLRYQVSKATAKKPTTEQLDNPSLMTNDNWAWYQNQ